MTRTKKALLGTGALLGVVALVVVARVAWYAPLWLPDAAPGELGFVWRGAIHVHSDISDGAAPVAEIMTAAEKAGLDFVVLTDHNPLGDRGARTGWYGDVLLVVAEEISTLEGHLLALQVAPHRYRFGGTARQALSDIREEGGWALAAHPHHHVDPWTGGRGGWDGLEVVNVAAAWSRRRGPSLLPIVGSAFVDGGFATTLLLADGWPALATWDRLTALTASIAIPRRRVAVGAADAHGPFVASFPSYETMLEAMSTLVWIDDAPGTGRDGDPEKVAQRLMGALRAGRAAVETTAVGDGRSFSFIARSAGGTALMGDFAPWEQAPWTLIADFHPEVDLDLILVQDGRPIRRAQRAPFEYAVTEPGTYRVEVYRGATRGTGIERPPDRIPWVVGNPIYVWPDAARSASRIRRVPPLPAPSLSRDLLAEAIFEGNERGAAGNNVATTERGVSWEFSLAAESTVEDFAALAWRSGSPMDWSAADGFVVDIGAREALRLNLEIRSVGEDGETRSWVTSIKASPDTTPVGIPWRRFTRPPSEVPSAELADVPALRAADLARVTGVFFVVTPAILAPGSRAAVQLRRLGLYGAG